jgi:hypothetical protein
MPAPTTNIFMVFVCNVVTKAVGGIGSAPSQAK